MFEDPDIYNPTKEKCTYCTESVSDGELILTPKKGKTIHICVDCLIKVYDIILSKSASK